MYSLVISSSVYNNSTDPSNKHKKDTVTLKQKTLCKQNKIMKRFNTVVSILSKGVERLPVYERDQYVKEINNLHIILSDLNIETKGGSERNDNISN